MKNKVTSRKSRMPSKSPESKIEIPAQAAKVIPLESIEEVSSFYISDMVKAEKIDNAIMCVFSIKDREISFEQDGTNKLKVKLHDKKSGYPLARSFTFKEIEKVFKDYFNKKIKAGE